jgi:branched-subunit amino acid aminotransferase/4-amino-4-deoxychorismate lyase
MRRVPTICSCESTYSGTVQNGARRQRNLCEGIGSTIFLVRDGRLLTPSERDVLPGVSRQATIDIARQLKIPLEERDIDLYDAYTADDTS